MCLSWSHPNSLDKDVIFPRIIHCTCLPSWYAFYFNCFSAGNTATTNFTNSSFIKSSRLLVLCSHLTALLHSQTQQIKPLFTCIGDFRAQRSWRKLSVVFEMAENSVLNFRFPEQSTDSVVTRLRVDLLSLAVEYRCSDGPCKVGDGRRTGVSWLWHAAALSCPSQPGIRSWCWQRSSGSDTSRTEGNKDACPSARLCQETDTCDMSHTPLQVKNS